MKYEQQPDFVTHIKRNARLLIDRYEHWYGDFTGQTACDSPLAAESDGFEQTVSGAISSLESVQAPGDRLLLVQNLARGVAECDFLDWSARDPATNALWEPLALSYKEFLVQFPHAEPCVLAQDRVRRSSAITMFLLQTPC